MPFGEYIELEPGVRFGTRVVVQRVENNANNNRQFLLVCDCGEESVVVGSELTRSKAKSCNRCAHVTHGHNRRLEPTSPTYQTWLCMKVRCLNSAHQAYHRYGGRGIKVCDRWLVSFVNFLEDMGERPDSKTIHRINNDGNYEPGNCKWATASEQAHGPKAKLLNAFGLALSMSEWADLLDLGKSTIYRHTSKGNTIEDVAKHFSLEHMIFGKDSDN